MSSNDPAMRPDELSNPAIRLDDLLAERPWVRSLARALVRDEQGAADLEQDTWVTALERPPRRPGSVRGWLASVMRSRLADRRRSDTRRSAREERVVATQQTTAPAAADLAARGELHRTVIEAVLALPVEQRDVVLLRYFEDQSAAEIASRYGINASTVRSRLARGLARLREDLDRSHGGDGTSWRAALLPLAFGTDGPAPSTTSDSPTPTSGGSPMSPLRLLATASFVFTCAAVAYVLWPDSPAAESTPPVEPVASVSDDEGGPRGPRHLAPVPDDEPPADTDEETTADPPFEPEPPADTAEETFELRGRVLDATGEPAAGARVTWVAAYAGKGPSTERVVATADAEGRVQFSFAESAYVRLLARHGDLAAAGGLIEGQPGRSTDVTLTLGPTLVVRGRLVDHATREPLVGAVRLHTKDEEQFIHFGGTRTDDAGRFEFAAVPVAAAARGVAVEAGSSGYQPGWEGWEPVEGVDRPPEFEIELRAATRARGRCIDERGEPIAEVHVTAVRGSASTLTDADGRFELRGLDAAELAILFEPSKHVAQRVVPEAGGGDWVEVGDVVLATGVTLRGRILHSDGTPAPNCSLNLLSEQADQFVRFGGTDDDGSFAIEHVGTGRHTLFVTSQASSAPHGVAEGAEVEGILPGEGPIEIHLRLGAMFQAVFRHAETGEEVTTTSAGIKLLIDGEMKQNSGTHGDALTGATLVADEAGTYDIEVRARGFETVLLRGVELRDGEVVRQVVKLTPRAD